MNVFLLAADYAARDKFVAWCYAEHRNRIYVRYASGASEHLTAAETLRRLENLSSQAAENR